MNIDKRYRYIVYLAIGGIGLAMYLLWQQWFHPAIQPCSVNAWVNCDAIISGPVAYTLGVPTAVIGMVGYIFILFSAWKKMRRFLTGMAAFGLIFCLYIFYRELFELRVLCPVCILCQVFMISIFCLAITISKEENIISHP